jgi:hypothetical protein
MSETKKIVLEAIARFLPIRKDDAELIAMRVEQRLVIDMIIFCPRCGTQHVDEPTPEWSNPPHKSHLCLYCKWIFRVSDVPTNGVREITTVGDKDSARPIREQQHTGRMQCVRDFGIDPGDKR